jgi:GPH family glycoside/pentoside/hexuronide:cation symporter
MLLAGIYKGAGLNLQLAWSATGATYGLVTMVLLVVTTLTVKERPELIGEPSSLPPVRAMLICFKNRPFVMLTAVYMLGIFAFTVQAAVFPYLLQYQLNMADQIPAVMAAAMLTIGIFLIPAKWVADKINKGPAYALGLFITATAFILAFFFLPRQSTPWVYLVAVIVGIGFSAQWIFPFAMLPDVIEHDEKMTGERREGIYYGISNFMTKFSMALGIAVTGWALNWYGYVPNAVQTENALFGIRLFYAVVPAAVLFICLPFLIWYPVTQKTHASLVRELADEKAALKK